MTHSTCLITYASAHGNVRQIAERLAGTLRDRGLAVTVADVRSDPDPATYDVVVAGGSVHREKHSPALAHWMSTHAATTRRRPFAVFSVSLMAAGSAPEQEATASRFLTDLLRETGCEAQLQATFAGALQYREYDVLTRWMMRRIARRQGLSGDTRRDRCYTDWAAVDAFADAISRLGEEPFVEVLPRSFDPAAR